MSSPKRVNRSLAAVALLAVAWLAYPAARRAVLRPETSAPLRGRELAASLGCFACHGPEGKGGVANPGSQRETVPGFTGRTLMMYVHDDDEIRQYVLDGRPDRRADEPDYRAEIEAQAIRMPAYRDALAPGEVDLLVAYVRTVSGLLEPGDELARRGLEVAQRMGCFGCHGSLGMGGRDNPGSLKGYVPGFTGEDFGELVRDDDELREWIRKGRLARLEDSWVGRWFARRQVVKMPAFERFLDDREVEALVALLRWIRSGAPAGAPLGERPS